MLFLAVSMGFIAENLRESQSERAREKEYVVALVKDLQEDTADLKVIIKRNQKKVAGLDTLLSLDTLDITTPAHKQLFYYCYKKYMGSVYFFKNTDVTLAQLKSTGGYRLIRKDSAAYKIAQYDQSMSTVREQENAYEKSVFDADATLFELIDINVMTNPAYFKGRAPTGKELPPVLNDPQKLRVYFNKVLFQKLVIELYAKGILQNELEGAKDLIGFLKEAYRI